MRTSESLIPTLKEAPNDAQIKSHQLMLRAGLIRKLASGLYTWLPLGLRVLRKVEKIVREEMNRAGAQELLMPAVQPAELWHETGRFDKFGPQLLKLKDRHERDFCFGPTHEEVITDLVRQELKSYKQLPWILYQIQTKFRDEIRPRFGVMRAREFLMKDAYSFHLTPESMEQGYQTMYQAYAQIFTRLGLKFRAVLADTGSIGGNRSQEFHVLADSGEDEIFYSNQSDYAANIELAPTLPIAEPLKTPTKTMEKKPTPNCVSVNEVSEYLKQPADTIIKTLIVVGREHPFVAVMMRGNHELNPIKAEKHPLIAAPLQLATREQVIEAIGCTPGSLGPINMPIPVIGDYAIAGMHDFACGANDPDHHFVGVNWQRDVVLPELADLRKVVVGDPSPDGQGTLEMARGIEVGHIFQLGTAYSQPMNLLVNDETGEQKIVYMGTYGIGVSRIVGAAIEQNNDEHGIVWPDAMAPFQVGIISLLGKQSEQVKKISEELYQTFKNKGIEVLWEDRDERPGVLFADMDLLGIPHQFIISERNLAQNKIEYKHRKTQTRELIEQNDVINFIVGKI